MAQDTNVKILGTLTEPEMREIQFAQTLVSEKQREIEVLRKGVQHIVNMIIKAHGFPHTVRLDFKSGVVYDVPVIGENDGGQTSELSR